MTEVGSKKVKQGKTLAYPLDLLPHHHISLLSPAAAPPSKILEFAHLLRFPSQLWC